MSSWRGWLATRLPQMLPARNSESAVAYSGTIGRCQPSYHGRPCTYQPGLRLQVKPCDGL